MIRGICEDCDKVRDLTKHSPKGHHQPPYVYVCRPCHDKIHNQPLPKMNSGKKYQPGTPGHRKKK